MPLVSKGATSNTEAVASLIRSGELLGGVPTATSL
jgi:hypothetical protein